MLAKPSRESSRGTNRVTCAGSGLLRFSCLVGILRGTTLMLLFSLSRPMSFSLTLLLFPSFPHSPSFSPPPDFLPPPQIPHISGAAGRMQRANGSAGCEGGAQGRLGHVAAVSACTAPADRNFTTETISSMNDDFTIGAQRCPD